MKLLLLISVCTQRIDDAMEVALTQTPTIDGFRELYQALLVLVLQLKLVLKLVTTS